MQELTAKTILAALNAHSEQLYALGARKLGLFGSFARGEQTPDIDIDILVTLSRPSYDDYWDVKVFLEKVFDRKVDLVFEDALKPRIRPYVLGEVIYAEGLQTLP
jgi:predicted nucleotidyltransferase